MYKVFTQSEVLSMAKLDDRFESRKVAIEIMYNTHTVKDVVEIKGETYFIAEIKEKPNAVKVKSTDEAPIRKKPKTRKRVSKKDK